MTIHYIHSIMNIGEIEINLETCNKVSMQGKFQVSQNEEYVLTGRFQVSGRT